MLTCDFVALLFDVAEGLGERLVEALIRTFVLHAEGFGYSRQTLELDDEAVLAHLLHLFAILDVDVRRRVLLVVFDSKAVTWWRTLAS